MTVHPRACGEQKASRFALCVAAGSSPRVRGTGRRSPARNAGKRFIPARAGNSAACWGRSPRRSVHPRACGEQVGYTGGKCFVYGSSPRVRGTVQDGKAAGEVVRFIPARAGNSVHETTHSGRNPVHPRACGEQARQRSHIKSDTGSSPRVRGTELAIVAGQVLMRFIPARAGNRCRGPYRAAGRTVHPRACGEQAQTKCSACSGDGSSPRVRGTAFQP